MGAAEAIFESLLPDLLAGAPGIRETILLRLRDARARHDTAAAAQAATLLLLHTVAEFSDFRALAEARAAFDPEPDDPVALRRADAVRLGLPSLDHGLDHADPALVPVRARIFAAVRDGAGIPADERLMLAKVLVDHDGMRNDFDAGNHVLAAAQHVVASASPRWQGLWHRQAAQWRDYLGDPVACQAALQRLQAMAERSGLPELRMATALEELRQALRVDDRPRAERASRTIDQVRTDVAPALLPRALRTQSTLLLRRGEYQAALDQTSLILALCDDHEVPERERAGYVEERCYALAGLGRHAEAIALMEGLRPTQLAGQGEVLEALIALLHAHAALAREADPRPWVLPAVRLAAACGLHGFLHAFTESAARVAAIGLEAGCEVEMLQRAVRQRRLPPPPGAGERWPWPLRLRVLGGYELLRDGAPLAGAGGKAQKKPLRLLALLAAHPEGLDSETLIDALWPSLEADAPRASLEMTVSRLRKWLDLPDAVRVADGRVALNPHLVRTDIADFDAAVRQGDAAAALAAYRGPLLAGERLEGLALQARDRLAHRLAAVVLQGVAALRERGQGTEALALLARGLALVPHSDPLQAALRAA